MIALFKVLSVAFLMFQFMCELKIRLVNWPVTVGVMHFLPVTGVHLLLGNDLAGGKIVVNPLVTANPSLDQIDPIEN